MKLLNNMKYPKINQIKLGRVKVELFLWQSLTKSEQIWNVPPFYLHPLASKAATAVKTPFFLKEFEFFHYLSCLFQLPKMSNVGNWNFPWVDFLGTALKFRNRKKNSSSFVCALYGEIRHFPFAVLQWRQRSVSRKKRDLYACKVVGLLI